MSNRSPAHAEIDHATPGRQMVRFLADGEHTFDGQLLPVNDAAKEAVAAVAEDGAHTWSVADGAEAYVPDAVAATLVEAGHAEAVEPEKVAQYAAEAERSRNAASREDDLRKLAELQAKLGV